MNGELTGVFFVPVMDSVLNVPFFLVHRKSRSIVGMIRV